jgi:hypothetical protein
MVLDLVKIAMKLDSPVAGWMCLTQETVVSSWQITTPSLHRPVSHRRDFTIGMDGS